jgi:hypothetical protein
MCERPPRITRIGAARPPRPIRLRAIAIEKPVLLRQSHPRWLGTFIRASFAQGRRQAKLKLQIGWFQPNTTRVLGRRTSNAYTSCAGPTVGNGDYVTLIRRGDTP